MENLAKLFLPTKTGEHVLFEYGIRERIGMWLCDRSSLEGVVPNFKGQA